MCSFSFSKTDRILKRKEFLRVSMAGEKLHDRHFIAAFCSGRFERTRLGVTITKKVGHAATRNRIKRYIREFFRLNRHNIAGNWDINIIAKKEAADLSSRRAFTSLKKIFDRISRGHDH